MRGLPGDQLRCCHSATAHILDNDNDTVPRRHLVILILLYQCMILLICAPRCLRADSCAVGARRASERCAQPRASGVTARARRVHSGQRPLRVPRAWSGGPGSGGRARATRVAWIQRQGLNELARMESGLLGGFIRTCAMLLVCGLRRRLSPRGESPVLPKCMVPPGSMNHDAVSWSLDLLWYLRSDLWYLHTA